MIPLSIVIELFSNFTETTKIFFTGDPAQLPPVDEVISSIFMKTESDITFRDYLKNIHVETSLNVVDKLKSDFKSF